MAENTHYDTLAISESASFPEIKQAYRQLVKQFHPDCNQGADSHDRIADINVAYEVLSDPQRRRSYDRQLGDRPFAHTSSYSRTTTEDRQTRTATAQKQYQQRRQTGKNTDEQLQLWLMRVYQPVNRMLLQIIKPLKGQLNDLAADPFDDELLEEFQSYLEECRTILQKAQNSFRSVPNPANVASVAAHLYYCLNQVSDGVDELERFVTSYDDHYLHTGQELFRIAAGLRREAQAALRELA
jgi:molecular chaperone DnaJ